MAKKRSEKMVFTYKLTEADRITYNHYCVLNTKRGKSTILWQKIMTVLFGIVLISISWFIPMSKPMHYFAIVACVAGIGYGVIRGTKLVLNSYEKSVKAQGETAAALNPPTHTVEFQDDCIIREVDGDDTDVINYSEIRDMEVNDTGLYLWLDGEEIRYFPFHAIGSAGMIDELYEMISEKVVGK